jgi:UDP:flavonoid glycosyltransferase YjiC (YdhE family)
MDASECLPIVRLIDHAAALLTHGGFNSVSEAMSRGCRWS